MFQVVLEGYAKASSLGGKVVIVLRHSLLLVCSHGIFQTVRTLRCAIHAINTILMVPPLLCEAAARFTNRWMFQVVHPSSLSSDALTAPEANICSCYLHFVSMYGAFMLAYMFSS